MNNSLVSIIINCYNGEKYLTHTLESILNQTYKNWEIVFWDNQSTDSSSKIFNSYKDSRFKYFYANEHTTLGTARNFAAEKSKGDFITFLDSDDFWDKNKLELQMSYFKNLEVGVVYSNLWILKKDKKKKLYMKRKLPRGNIYNELIKNYCVGILTAVIRKKFYLKVEKKFDERFTIIGDFDFFLRLSKLCFFESVQEPLAYYRLHGGNLSTVKKEKEIEEYEIWFKENKVNLSVTDVQNLQKNIDNRKFVNSKIDGRYKECLNMLINSKTNIFTIKNLIIFFTPIVLLKRILWYHQD